MGAATTAGGVATTRDEVAVKKKGPKAQGPPWWIYIAVAGVVIFCLFPFYWLVNISLKTGPDLSSADLWPPNPSLENYKSIFQNDDFTRALANSAIVSLVTTFVGLIVGAFAAYALARLKMNFKFILLGIVLTISTFPQIAIAAPLFRLWTDIGLYNTLIGLDHPVPDVRAAAVDLHPRVVLPRDPQGPRGGGARGRRDELRGVPQGDRPAGRTRAWRRRPSWRSSPRGTSSCWQPR